ncbi:hypothetical protein BDN70DRAFT_938138 [Pholiota conissans]|uniref:Uncharacterized protein n=1 Tax=Pholiota conissans TaxID=109636 RepID=A0A9P6CSY2_9AGAR|nr:hypothetical protein BDN70DRAFT_938138 [Pholiota conissans]
MSSEIPISLQAETAISAQHAEHIICTGNSHKGYFPLLEVTLEQAVMISMGGFENSHFEFAEFSLQNIVLRTNRGDQVVTTVGNASLHLQFSTYDPTIMQFLPSIALVTSSDFAPSELTSTSKGTTSQPEPSTSSSMEHIHHNPTHNSLLLLHHSCSTLTETDIDEEYNSEDDYLEEEDDQEGSNSEASDDIQHFLLPPERIPLPTRMLKQPANLPPQTPTPDPRAKNIDLPKPLHDPESKSNEKLTPSKQASSKPMDASATSLPHIYTLTNPLALNSTSESQSSPLLQPESTIKHPLDLTPQIHSQKRQRLYDAHIFSLNKTAYPHILGYGPVPHSSNKPFFLGHSSSYAHQYKFMIVRVDKLGTRPIFGYGNPNFLKEPYIIKSLPFISELGIKPPYSRNINLIIDNLLRLLRHPYLDGFDIPDWILTNPHFNYVEELLAIAELYFHQENIPLDYSEDEFSSEPSSEEYTDSELDWMYPPSSYLSSSRSTSPGQDLISPLNLDTFIDLKPLPSVPFPEKDLYSFDAHHSNLSLPSLISFINSEPLKEKDIETTLAKGILGLGPFPFKFADDGHFVPQIPHAYKVWFYPTIHLDARYHYALGGDLDIGGPMQLDATLDSPYPSNENLPSDQRQILQHLEYYLASPNPAIEGVDLPSSILYNHIQIGYDDLGKPIFYFPDAKCLLATTVQTIKSSQFNHLPPTKFPNYDRDLAQIDYSIELYDNNIEFEAPDIPCDPVYFDEEEPCHPLDDGESLFHYHGSLHRQEAFAYLHAMETLYEPITNAVSTVYELFLMVAHPRSFPLPHETEINWKSILSPRNFSDVFPKETPNSLLAKVQPQGATNPWIHYICHPLDC